MDLSIHRHFYPSVQDIFQLIGQPFRMMEYAISDANASHLTIGKGKNRITIPVNHIVLTRIKKKSIKKRKKDNDSCNAL